MQGTIPDYTRRSMKTMSIRGSYRQVLPVCRQVRGLLLWPVWRSFQALAVEFIVRTKRDKIGIYLFSFLHFFINCPVIVSDVNASKSFPLLVQQVVSQP